MKQLFVSNSAVKDLREIGKYIHDKNPKAAVQLLTEIDARFSLFCEQPEIGKKRDEIVSGLRSFNVGNYVLFYLDKPNAIEIARVLHGSQDLSRAFKKDAPSSKRGSNFIKNKDPS